MTAYSSIKSGRLSFWCFSHKNIRAGGGARGGINVLSPDSYGKFIFHRGDDNGPHEASLSMQRPLPVTRQYPSEIREPVEIAQNLRIKIFFIGNKHSDAPLGAPASCSR